jgi:hypothetical protein
MYGFEAQQSVQCLQAISHLLSACAFNAAAYSAGTAATVIITVGSTSSSSPIVRTIR